MPSIWKTTMVHCQAAGPYRLPPAPTEKSNKYQKIAANAHKLHPAVCIRVIQRVYIHNML